MADDILHITVSYRWWVKPYLFVLSVFVRCFAPFADEDELGDFIDREIDWAVKRGVVIKDT